MATLIKGSRLLDGNGAVLNNAAVLVEDGRIVAVGSQDDIPTQPGVEVIDGGTKTIMPGLVDAHVHLVNTGETFSARDARVATDDEMMILAVKNAQLAIKSGVTTVRDLGGKGFLTVSLRDAIDKGVIPGPRVVSCAAALTITGGQSYYKALVADTADEMKKAGKSYEPVTYEGAGHAFMRRGEETDPSEANRKAMEEAWERWLGILETL